MANSSTRVLSLAAKGTRPGSFSRSQPPPSAPPSPLLRVFCHGIDDVRLYRALSEAGALGRVVVAASVGEADAVLAVRIKRTGRAVSMDLVRWWGRWRR